MPPRTGLHRALNALNALTPAAAQALTLGLNLTLGLPAHAQHPTPILDPAAFDIPNLPDATAEANRDLRRVALPKGWSISNWAAEPRLLHPVAFDITDDGRVFVAESLRAWRGVPDMRNLFPWLDEDIAARSVDDRLALMRRIWGDQGLQLFRRQSEQVRLLRDADQDGRADADSLFATGFDSPLDGVASSVLARGNEVWFANIPDIWWLHDADGDGKADQRRSLSHGHGVRISMLGHDLHGLAWGPDGRIYVSVGDRASHLLHEGRWIGHPECGAVFRFEPDGSHLEMFAFGLRNPQELVFDDWGNLFSGDNSSNTGDESRWVHIVPHGDSGWRIGWQWAENPAAINDGNWRAGAEGPGAISPWITEELWKPAHPNQPAYIIPPVANFSAGPCGNALYPGTGLDPSFTDTFLLTDFRGSSNDSLLWRFRLAPKGASFTLRDRSEWLRGINATDIAFGPDGALWILDWTDGWEPAGRGRIHRLHPPTSTADPTTATTARLLRDGFRQKPVPSVVSLLAHPDRRVRQGAQFELAARTTNALPALRDALGPDQPIPSRRHAAWALGQIARQARNTGQSAAADALVPVLTLLDDPHPGIRTIAARILGEASFQPASTALLRHLADPEPTVRTETALALAQLHAPTAVPALIQGIESAIAANPPAWDPVVRHATVIGLLGSTDVHGLLALAAHPQAEVRRTLVVALRRLERTEVARFLDDPHPLVRAEAARAIHDVPIHSALPLLAAVPEERLQEPAFARRVLNARLRSGDPDSALRLAASAANVSLPSGLRAEALRTLAAWPAPTGRDRITGLWRPITTPRDPALAARALAPRLESLFTDPAPDVLVEAVTVAGTLGITAAGPGIARIALDHARPAVVRNAALQAVATLASPGLPALLDQLTGDPQPDVRAAALRLATRSGGPGSVSRLERVLRDGTDSDRQAAFAALARLPSADAAPLVDAWATRWLAGDVPAGLHLDLIEAVEAVASPNIQSSVREHLQRLATPTLSAPFLLALEGGSPRAGQAIFQSPEVECVRCHKLFGRGGSVGPELSTIGSRLDRRTLLESITAPDARLAPGYETVLITLTDGSDVAGIATAESATSLTLLQADGSTTTLPKERIRTRERGHSAMPSGLAEILGPRRLRDLVAFLASLRGP